MKNKHLAVACLVLLLAPVAATASPAEPHSDEVSAAAEVVDAFEAALRAGDLERVSALLDPNVLIYESGGAERSREEYLASHAKADAEFLQGTRGDKATAFKVVGDVAWATSTATLEYQRDGKPAAADTAETMVLRRGPDGWKIVHIHWSSRAAR